MMFFLSTRRMRNFLTTGIFSVVFSVTFLFSAPPAHAQAWGAVNIFSDLMINIMEQIQTQIRAAILGTLKVAAVEVLNSRVGQLIGGSAGGQALFITDWDNFLYQTPLQKTHLYMNDFFTLSTRGKYAAANYTGVGDVSSDLTGNYVAYLVGQAKEAVKINDAPIAQYDLDQYTPNPQTMFREGDWRAFNAFFSNPANNPPGYRWMAENAYASELQKQMKITEIEAQSQGYVGAKTNGITTTPAGSVQALATDVQNLGNKLIVAANNPGELLSGIVSGVVNRAVSNLVQRGVGQIQTSIRREIRNVDNQVAGAINQANTTIGTAAQFSRSLNQRINVNVNTKTPPPPNPQFGP
jgi:hypothetical protein